MGNLISLFYSNDNPVSIPIEKKYTTITYIKPINIKEKIPLSTLNINETSLMNPNTTEFNTNLNESTLNLDQHDSIIDSSAAINDTSLNLESPTQNNKTESVIKKIINDTTNTINKQDGGTNNIFNEISNPNKINKNYCGGINNYGNMSKNIHIPNLDRI